MEPAASPGAEVPTESPVAVVGVRGLLVAALVASVTLVLSVVWVAAPAPAAAGEVTIVMDEYSFAPSELTWRAGQTVTVTIVNRSSSRPGVPHEIMFGRTPLQEEGPFGPLPGDGFESQFLDGASIELVRGQGVRMIMADTARLTGVDPMSLMPPGMDMSGQPMRMGMDFMAVLEPGGSLTFRFQVPQLPGRWEFGCFQQDGQHYRNGMRGIVTVVSS